MCASHFPVSLGCVVDLRWGKTQSERLLVVYDTPITESGKHLTEHVDLHSDSEV